MSHLEERRRKRSADPLVALHYQLAYARKNGALEAIVVADACGLVVAGAGSWATCEELAAYAPMLAQPDPRGELTPPVASRVESLRGEVHVRTMMIDGQEVLLCARGGAARDLCLASAAQGVARILGQAA
jgi:hypothetical protein